MRTITGPIVLLLCSKLLAQGFNVVDLPPNNYGSTGVSVREVPEGFLVFSGAVDSTLTYRGRTALFDAGGSLIAGRSWVDAGPSSLGYYDAISKALPDGSYLASVATSLADSGRWRAYRFNSAYDTTWTRTLLTTAFVYSRSAAYQAGSCYFSSLLRDSINSDDRAAVARLDEQGNVRTIRYFPEIAYDMLSLSAGAGEDVLLTGGCSGNAFPFRSVVMRLDTALNTLWSREIISNIPGFTNCSSYVSKVTHDPDGDVFVAGSLYDETEWPNSNVEFYVLKLARADGSVIWSRRLPLNSTEFGNLNDIECLPDGDLVTSANATPYDTSGSTAGIYRYTPNGLERWHRYYGFLHNPDAENDLIDVEPVSDGGFILTGTTQLSYSYPTVTWVLRLDPYGCLEPGCQSVGVNEVMVGLPNEALRCSPVPAHDRLSVNIELPAELVVHDQLRLCVTDLEGRVMQRMDAGTLPNVSRSFDVSSWDAGTYVVHLIDGERLLGARKIMVQ